MAEKQIVPEQKSLRRRERQYERLRAELGVVTYILQGSITRRWMQCGKPGCPCHQDPKARHGPYCQWSWKRAGKTVSLYLDKEQAALCRQWIANNRKLERIIQRMRVLSLRVARLRQIVP